MSKPYVSLAVDDAHQRHPPELEQVDLLTIHTGHLMIRIGQTNERNAFIRPVAFEGLKVIWPQSKNFNPA